MTSCKFTFSAMSPDSIKSRRLFAIITLVIILALSASVFILLFLSGLQEAESRLLRLVFITESLILLGTWIYSAYRFLDLSHQSGQSESIDYTADHSLTEQALRESEERFKLLIENAPVGIITFEPRGRIIDINSKVLEILGSPGAAQTREINVLELPQMVEAGISEDFIDCLTRGTTGLHEKPYITKWGKKLILRYNLAPLRNVNHDIIGALAILEDFTQRKAAEDEMQTLHIQARENARTQATLLEEVNHRVKNNLAGIIGMLYATSRFVKNAESRDEYLSSLENLIHRIEGIATVHEILTEANWSPLPFGELTNRIISSSLQALPMDRQIVTKVIADDDILILPKHANNLGMVINELVTNTIKHAVDNRQSASVTVNITRENEEVLFRYFNDGPGFPADILNLKSINTGMYLIETIVKNGLGGSLTLENKNGAVTCIRFKP